MKFEKCVGETWNGSKGGDEGIFHGQKMLEMKQDYPNYYNLK